MVLENVAFSFQLSPSHRHIVVIAGPRGSYVQTAILPVPSSTRPRAGTMSTLSHQPRVAFPSAAREKDQAIHVTACDGRRSSK
jgi:hypothetical protein